MSSINELDRENILLGTSIHNEPIYKIIEGCSDEELEESLQFYDYVTITTGDQFKPYVLSGEIKEENIRRIIKRVVDICDKIGVIPVASDEATHIFTEDTECEKILLMNKGAPYRNHLLSHFRNTEEMFNEFNILDKDKTYELVITNTNRIAEMIENTFSPFDDDLQYSNKIKDLQGLTYEAAYKKYGYEIPLFIKKRIDLELSYIEKSNKLTLQYLIYASLAEKAASKGFLSFGHSSAGSSLVAFLLNLTNVNPLPPHYHCKKCNYTEFHENEYCGEDLPAKNCPICNSMLAQDGFNIPLETFFGIDGCKINTLSIVTEINLDIQEIKTKIQEIFPCKMIYHGMPQKITHEKAITYFDNYCKKDKYKHSDSYKIEICEKLSNVKEKTIIDPFSVFIIPDNKQIYDFTPVQYSNNDSKTPKITHFHCCQLDSFLLSIHVRRNKYLSLIYMLEKITSISSKDISFGDTKTIGTIKAGRTAGLPEFSSEFSKELISSIGFKKMSDLIKLSGFCRGTYGWNITVKTLINEGVSLSDIASTKEDIYFVARDAGIDIHTAIELFEQLQTSQGLTYNQERDLYNYGISEDFIRIINDIVYLYPKAQCVEYVKLSYVLSYYKTYFPLEFYCEFINLNIKEYNETILNFSNKNIYELTNTYKMHYEDIPEILTLAKEIEDSGYDIITDNNLKVAQKAIIDNGKIKLV